MPSVKPLKRRRTPETSRKVHQAQEDTKRIARETRTTSQLLDLNTEVERKRSLSGLLDTQIQRMKKGIRDLKNEKRQLEQGNRLLKQEKARLMKENLDMRKRFDQSRRPPIRRMEHQRRRDTYTTNQGLPPR